MRGRRAATGLVVVGLLLGGLALGLLLPRSVGASGLSPCQAPFYSGLWSGTWAASPGPPSGPSGPPAPLASGTWKAQLTLSPATLTVAGTFSMDQTSPSAATLFSNTAITGSLSCTSPATQVELVFFSSSGTSVQFTGTLSDDGSQFLGAYQSASTHGTFQATKPSSPLSALASCASGQICHAKIPTAPSVNFPAQTVEMAGTSSGSDANLELSVTVKKLACPHIKAAALPVADEQDSLPPRTPINATVTLLNASQTGGVEQVCFNSTVPFKSQSSPTVAKAGSALLLACAKVANVAPCVTSSKQVGNNVVVRFVVPAGDPQFTLVLPTGREMWQTDNGTGKVGSPYSAHIGYKGGIAPIHWAVKSGNLPNGCSLNPNTGAITGTPTSKATAKFTVLATDSEKTKKTATITLTINIT
jgi:Putative Ig domain